MRPSGPSTSMSWMIASTSGSLSSCIRSSLLAARCCCSRSLGLLDSALATGGARRSSSARSIALSSFPAIRMRCLALSKGSSPSVAANPPNSSGESPASPTRPHNESFPPPPPLRQQVGRQLDEIPNPFLVGAAPFGRELQAGHQRFGFGCGADRLQQLVRVSAQPECQNLLAGVPGLAAIAPVELQQRSEHRILGGLPENHLGAVDQAQDRPIAIFRHHQQTRLVLLLRLHVPFL